MERLTYYDETCKCYKVKRDAAQRNLVQELGVFEDIHESEIHKATNYMEIRDQYIKKGVKLNPWWNQFGRKEE